MAVKSPFKFTLGLGAFSFFGSSLISNVLHFTQYSASSEYCVSHIGQRFNSVPPFKVPLKALGFFGQCPDFMTAGKNRHVPGGFLYYII